LAKYFYLVMSMGLAGVERGRRRVATLASGVEGAEKRAAK